MTAPPLAPYKGLRMFEDSELDVPFYFGRERERGLVEANLMASRLTVLYGETGVGKSSLLRAGVAHHLRETAVRSMAERGDPELAVVVFDSWRDDPVGALRRACTDEVTRALGGRTEPADDGRPLAETLRVWQQLLGGDLYIVLDQVEEYFLYHHDEDGPGDFAAELAAVVTSADLRVNFLLAIREDAVAKLDAFKPRIPNVLGNYLRLEHLDRDAGRAAIVGPVTRYNELMGADERVELEPELVDAVLDQVVTGRVLVRHGGRGTVGGEERADRVETPYLQLVMQRLWDEERSAGSRALRLGTLLRLGGAEQIVGDHVSRALAALTSGQQDLAATIFDYLVTPSGTKIAHEVSDLERYAGAPHPSVVSVLHTLSDDRIVRAIANGNGHAARYEIFHDVLAEPVLAWKATHDSERALERQRAEAETRHRRMVRIVVLGAIALAVMAGITILAITQRTQARSQANIARARELAAVAVSQLQVDPQRSLDLAVQSARRKPTSEIEDVLRQALIAARERAVLPSGGKVRAASFSPDGRLVLTASDDGTARIWRRDGTPVRTLRQRGPVTAARFSPDGRFVLTTSADGTARLWRAADGGIVASLRHGGPVTGGAFSADGRTAVTTSADGTARVWDVPTGRPVAILRHPGAVLAASFSADGRSLVTVASDRDGSNRRARVFALPTGRLLHELAARGVDTASFSPDARLIVTGGIDHKAALWAAASGRLVHVLGKHLGAVTDAEFGPGGRLVATASTDGATRVWDVRTGARVAQMLGHSMGVKSVSFSPDGVYLITTSSDGTARVWEAATGRPQFVLRGHTATQAVVDASFSPDGQAVVTAGDDGTARVWDPGTAPELRLVAAIGRPLRAAVFGPDGRSLLVAGDDGTARILVDGRVVRTLRHPAPVTSAIFSRDGRLVVTADAQRTVRVWRAGDGALVRTVGGLTAGPLASSEDGRLLAAPTADGRIRIFDATTFSVVREFRRGKPFVSASFGPDGQMIVTAGTDGDARIWDVPTGKLLRVFAGHRAALTDAEFSADGTLVVTSSRDHLARVWQVATGASTVVRGHFGPVFAASLSPDNRFVVTAGPTTAGLWLAASGRWIAYLHGHTGPLTSATFSSDGQRILTSSRDGTVREYGCDLCGGVNALVAVAEARLGALGRPLSDAARRRYVP